MSAAAVPIPHPASEGSLLTMIGGTPLLRIASLGRGMAGVEVWAKAEHLNPGGSVKDRPALRMIQQGIREGKLTPEKTLLDSTSGNTGIAYAMICSALGYRVKLCMSAGASKERQAILRAHGVDLVLTPAAESSDGAARRCHALYAEDPDAYFYPDQYNNPANWQAHYHGTGVEILQQTSGNVTHFVAGVGTSGTLMGVGRRLRQELRRVTLVSVQPAVALHGLEGLKHMETAIVPGIYDPALADADLRVETEDAWRMCKRMAREEGLLIGVSAGANLVAAERLAQSIASRRERATIITILCDGAAKYLSEHFWNDPDY
ncbi:MAG: cysteine synthase family protein [Bryobacterales bacterium]|jgi:cysteine synthase B|nr:cysteine synthase family protein [Bryobacterales bacterium]